MVAPKCKMSSPPKIVVSRQMEGTDGKRRSRSSIPARSPEVSLGSDDSFKLWLNGVLVGQQNMVRGVAPDQNKIRLELAAGENKLLFKVSNGGCGYAFYFKANPIPLPPTIVAALNLAGTERNKEEQEAHFILVSMTRMADLAATAWLVLAALANTIFSSVFTFADRVLYPSYSYAPRLFGTTALSDQSAAGAFMWVAGALVILPAVVAVAVGFLGPHVFDFSPCPPRRVAPLVGSSFLSSSPASTASKDPLASTPRIVRTAPPAMSSRRVQAREQAKWRVERQCDELINGLHILGGVVPARPPLPVEQARKHSEVKRLYSVCEEFAHFN